MLSLVVMSAKDARSLPRSRRLAPLRSNGPPAPDDEAIQGDHLALTLGDSVGHEAGGTRRERQRKREVRPLDARGRAKRLASLPSVPGGGVAPRLDRRAGPGGLRECSSVAVPRLGGTRRGVNEGCERRRADSRTGAGLPGQRARAPARPVARRLTPRAVTA